MPERVPIRIDYFACSPLAGTTNEVVKSIEAFISKEDVPDHMDRHFGNHEFRLSELSWSKDLKRLSGVMYKKQYIGLPYEISDDGEEPVQVAEDSALGNAVCFCYYPKEEVAVVQFDQRGARCKTLREFLAVICPHTPLETDAFLTDEAYETLKHAKIVKSLTFKLKNPKPVDLEGLGSAGRAIKSLTSEYEGIDVEVRVSMGRVQRRGLNLATVRKGVEACLTAGDVCAKLKVGAKPGIDDDLEELDLLRECVQDVTEVPTTEPDRVIDTVQCINRLHALYLQRKKEGALIRSEVEA